VITYQSLTKEEMKEVEEEYMEKLCKIFKEELMQYIKELDDEEKIAELFETETPQIREMHHFGRDISINHHVRRAQKEDCTGHSR